MTKNRSESAIAQDLYAQLVEEVRLGWVYRSVYKNGRWVRHEHKTDVDLDIPVFWMGDSPMDAKNDTDCGAVCDALEENRFKLPYPRCAFAYMREFGHAVFVAEQSPDEAIFVRAFLFRTDEKRWNLQPYQTCITPYEADVEISFDPGSGIVTPTEKLIDKLMTGATRFFRDVHRLMTETGVVSYADGGQATTRINARRNKLSLPDVPRLRVINFNAPPVQATPASTGTGSPRRPHFRRGTWRNLQSGKQVWVRPAAIHGGGDDPPPWYEVRG